MHISITKHLKARCRNLTTLRVVLCSFLVIVLTSPLGIAKVWAQSPTPAATPTSDSRILDDAQRDNEAAQADYYRAQTEKLREPEKPRTFWRTLSDNAAILGALTAALVALFTLIVNQRTALRARKDTEFYEALKRFGDKDSPTVRASAAAVLRGISNTGFFALRWRRNAPWWRPDQKMRRYPYFDTVLDQLITGLLIEENSVVIHTIVEVLKSIMTNNFMLSADRLRQANLKLQDDLSFELTALLIAKGMTVDTVEERTIHWYEAQALTGCSIDALEDIYTYDDPGVTFGLAAGTYSLMDETQKRAHLMKVQNKLEDLGGRLRLNLRLCEVLLKARSQENTQPLDFDDAYLPEIDLREANLRDVSFAAAWLNGADLYGAKLARANFTEANLRDVYLNDAELTDTKFGKIRWNINTQMHGGNWWQANFASSDNTNVRAGDVHLNETVDKELVQLLMSYWTGQKILPEILSGAHPSVKPYLERRAKRQKK